MKTDTGKIINRKFISGALFQTERRAKKESTINASDKINPKNRHCLRDVDGNYGRCDEILRDIVNGQLKIVQNRKATDIETEDDDDDDDDEEAPEEIGTPKHTILPNAVESIYQSEQKTEQIRYCTIQWKLLGIVKF